MDFKRVGRGVEVGELRHIELGDWSGASHPARSDYSTFADFADPDGNLWLLQERGYGAEQG
jgi:hypothetical protein